MTTRPPTRLVGSSVKTMTTRALYTVGATVGVAALAATTFVVSWPGGQKEFVPMAPPRAGDVRFVRADGKRGYCATVYASGRMIISAPTPEQCESIVRALPAPLSSAELMAPPSVTYVARVGPRGRDICLENFAAFLDLAEDVAPWGIWFIDRPESMILHNPSMGVRVSMFPNCKTLITGAMGAEQAREVARWLAGLCARFVRTL